MNGFYDSDWHREQRAVIARTREAATRLPARVGEMVQADLDRHGYMVKVLMPSSVEFGIATITAAKLAELAAEVAQVTGTDQVAPGASHDR